MNYFTMNDNYTTRIKDTITHTVTVTISGHIYKPRASAVWPITSSVLLLSDKTGNNSSITSSLFDPGDKSSIRYFKSKSSYDSTEIIVRFQQRRGETRDILLEVLGSLVSRKYIKMWAARSRPWL